jgi:hypothetical protein
VKQFASALWRTVIPEAARHKIYRLRVAASSDAPIIPEPTYAEDGLISQHVCDFMRDSKFLASYSSARDGVPWSHPGEIRFRAYVACWAAQHALNLDGDFVECGVGHGIYSRTVCDYVDFEKTGRRFFLFDTFAGIPTDTSLTDAERRTAEIFNKTHYSGDMLGRAKKKFSKFSNVQLVPGIIPNSIDNIEIDKIAYLSIDMNNAAAEIGAIRKLWDRLVPGAIVLLDDYAYGKEFMDQKRAWDIFALEKGVPILTTPTGQGMIIR